MAGQSLHQEPKFVLWALSEYGNTEHLAEP